MKLSIDLKTTLTQTLTPQQIQYLKLLQLPVLQFEQQIRQEIESNPMLEEVSELDDLLDADEIGILPNEQDNFTDTIIEEPIPSNDYDNIDGNGEFEIEEKELIIDERDPFEYYEAIWQDESEVSRKSSDDYDEYEDYEPYQINAPTSIVEDLFQQLRVHNLTEEELLLGSHILGNIDDDGYLRRELQEIVDETNSFIANHNFEIQKREFERKNNKPIDFYKQNPARMFALGDEAAELLSKVINEHPDIAQNIPKMELYKKFLQKKNENNGERILNQVNIEQAERILKLIQSLDPPGIGSRTIQECLLSQLEHIQNPNDAQKLAIDILRDGYDAFAKKHYHVLIKQFDISEEQLKAALDIIKRLNPKPGGGDNVVEMNTVIPDFIVVKDDNGELTIIVNDGNMPQIRLSSAYERLRREIKSQKVNKETREWIRSKYEDAKFLIQAIRQRKATMLKVMTAIAHHQREFFDYGISALKPLIYKDVAEATGLDISTVCRIVNGKYVQTQFGTFELKFFFSESLPNDEGEEVSTTVIKEEIKKIIDQEPKDKPYSDDKISDLLKERGYNVARRTVAKYREQLKIPVARLRKEL
ncbi:MAG TPA: RNA polymerase factor sigma-54 [Candidatus Kapabacteria bacterium]|nr:RNA polymerase factor sigma-54 [Candidatus Kapabacteria bacterium]